MFRRWLSARRPIPKALSPKFRPFLTELENRIVPSSSPTSGFLHGPAGLVVDSLQIQILTTPNPVQTQPVLQGDNPIHPDDPTPANPAANIDFNPLGANNPAYKLQIYLRAGQIPGDVSLSQSYNIAAGASPQAIRDLVLASLNGTGWNVSASGTTILTITGYTPQVA